MTSFFSFRLCVSKSLIFKKKILISKCLGSINWKGTCKSCKGYSTKSLGIQVPTDWTSSKVILYLSTLLFLFIVVVKVFLSSLTPPWGQECFQEILAQQCWGFGPNFVPKIPQLHWATLGSMQGGQNVTGFFDWLMIFQCPHPHTFLIALRYQQGSFPPDQKFWLSIIYAFSIFI